MDYYTSFPNCTGTPAITIPVQERGSKLSSPRALSSKDTLGDYHLLRIAESVDQMLEAADMKVV